MEHRTLDDLCINTVRTLAIDAIQKANSGHPGLPLGAAPMAYVLWHRHLKHNPQDPTWADRDRFVLSAGHGSMLIYALLHLAGYDLSLDDLKAFRQLGSKTPGHPETFATAGVEATTGPLGQGTANAVGMALAERILAHRFNRPGHTIVDHHTYALVSDGDLMEGVSAEAASLAGHLGLGKLIYLYDANDISLDGPTSLTFTENVAQRYEAYGWHVQTVGDGNTDLDALDAALAAARQENARPSLIVVKTTIGFGSPNKAGSAASHGAPLGAEEANLTKQALGWSEPEPFTVPANAAAHFRIAGDRGAAQHQQWKQSFETYQAAHPELARDFNAALAGTLPPGWEDALPTFEAGSAIATRAASGQVLNAIAPRLPELIGGDADLSVSTQTAIKDGNSFDGATGAGRNIHFGVREHAMGAIANGMAYHGGVRPYTATFFCFVDYMRPTTRLAALNNLPVIQVFTHDSIALGEDGPTHQPVEHLASLRCMPNVTVIRPADSNETAEAWRFAIGHRDGPIALVLTRQKIPTLDRTVYASAEGLQRGAYVLAEPKKAPQGILIATGSEVPLALEAQTQLEAEGISVRVVSMPSWELFAQQDAAYRDSVLPPSLPARVAVEAGSSFGWERYVGDAGAVIGVDRFGASAPGPQLYEAYGLTADAVATTLRQVLNAGRG